MMIGSMHTSTTALNTAEFAGVARLLAGEARRLGLVAPGFRCPPRIVGVDRTIRRFSGEERAGVVSVAVKSRPLAAVIADMIEGVIVLNSLPAVESTLVRAALWRSLDQSSADATATASAHDAHVA
jgi:hypothetical protein